MISAFFVAISPYLYQIILALFVLYIAPELEKYLQVKSDDSRRMYLEDAILNGISSAHIEFQGTAQPTLVVEHVTSYVKATVPYAIKELKLSDAGLKLIISTRVQMFNNEYQARSEAGPEL